MSCLDISFTIVLYLCLGPDFTVSRAVCLQAWWLIIEGGRSRRHLFHKAARAFCTDLNWVYKSDSLTAYICKPNLRIGNIVNLHAPWQIKNMCYPVRSDLAHSFSKKSAAESMIFAEIPTHFANFALSFSSMPSTMPGNVAPEYPVHLPGAKTICLNQGLSSRPSACRNCLSRSLYFVLTFRIWNNRRTRSQGFHQGMSAW
jgi:hypothetical protein